MSEINPLASGDALWTVLIRWWLVDWRQQTRAGTIVEFSVTRDSRLMALWICHANFRDIHQLKTSYLQAANELKILIFQSLSNATFTLPSQSMINWIDILRQQSLLFTTWYIAVKSHDDVIKWKHFPRYWPFVRGIHRSTELWCFLWSAPE